MESKQSNCWERVHGAVSAIFVNFINFNDDFDTFAQPKVYDDGAGGDNALINLYLSDVNFDILFKCD